jgi:hypothetical protein
MFDLDYWLVLHLSTPSHLQPSAPLQPFLIVPLEVSCDNISSHQAAILNMRQEADGFPAFGQKAGEIRRNQPVSGSAAPIFWDTSSIFRIAAHQANVHKSDWARVVISIALFISLRRKPVLFSDSKCSQASVANMSALWHSRRFSAIPAKPNRDSPTL